MRGGGLGGWQIGGIATAEQINHEPLLSTFSKKEKNSTSCTPCQKLYNAHISVFCVVGVVLSATA